MRSTWMIAGVAALAVSAPAQDAPRSAAQQQKNTLASTRWFVDATEKVVDADPDEEGECVEVTISFDAKGHAQVLVGEANFPATACTQKTTAGTVRVSAKAVGADKGEVDWQAVVSDHVLKGTLNWSRPGHEKRAFELVGRKATVLDGTRWKITVTPQKVSEDDEIAPPFSETVEFHRGHVRIVETDDSQLSVEPAAYTLKTAGQQHSIVTGRASERVDGAQWRLEVQGTDLTGALTQEDDGEVFAKYALKGTQMAPAKPTNASAVRQR